MYIIKLRECPSCGRLQRRWQTRCSCGYCFSGKRDGRFFKVCPACGSIQPQRTLLCSCGHLFLVRRDRITQSDLDEAYQRGWQDALQEAAPAAAPPDPPVKASADPGAGPRRRIPKLVPIAAGAVALALAAFLLFPRSGDSAPPVPTQKPQSILQDKDIQEWLDSFTPQPTAEAPQPVAVKNGQIVRYPSEARLAPFSVEAPASGTSKGLYIVLSPVGSTSAKARMSFFVESGNTAEVHVPLGVFEVYYASGRTWYGPDHLFGPSTQYYKCDKSFSFKADGDEYLGWTLELYPQTDGNLDTVSVDEEDFPSW